MDKALLDKLAAFNKIDLTADEEQSIMAEFDRIISRLEPLREAVFLDVPIMVHPDSVEPVYREDIIEQSVSRSDILAQAPSARDNCFVVPRVAD